MSEVAQNNQIICPTLHHLNLKTTRLQEMIDWYRLVVGMRVMFQFAGGAWLTNDRANHRLALLTSPQLSDDLDQSIHAGIHHCAFEFLSIDELLSTYMRLKAALIEPRVCLDHGMTTSFYYIRRVSDPQTGSAISPLKSTRSNLSICSNPRGHSYADCAISGGLVQGIEWVGRVARLEDTGWHAHQRWNTSA